MPFSAESQIARFYRTLHDEWGPQNWWPAESPFEVVIGAILTQNTSWTNVERALNNLRAAGVLSLEGIRRTEAPELEKLLRPAGYFRQKTRRLQQLAAHIARSYEVGPDCANKKSQSSALERMLNQPTSKLRTELLEQKGIGPETADSILLYAGNHPVFVIDAYTRRVFERHRVVPTGAGYDTLRLLVERSLQISLANEPKIVAAPSSCRPGIHCASAMSSSERPKLVQRYNEFHALLVQVGKHYCLKAAPKCEGCPLARFL